MISPLPWLVVQNEEDSSIQILDSDGICVVYDYGFLSLEDANFIVDIVNKHYSNNCS